jgi:hypothetical protein
MAWVVYYTEQIAIIDIFYLKKTAKETYGHLLGRPEKYGIAIAKVDMRKLDEWRVWKLLGGGNYNGVR